MKIDFKNHKKETRHYLLEQYKKQTKKELIEDLVFGLIIVLVFGLLFWLITLNNKAAFESCVKSGRSHDYCEAMTYD